MSWAKGTDMRTERPIEDAAKRPRPKQWAKDVRPNLLGGKNCRVAIGEGRREFNAHCSHCHAPPAEQRADLGRLRIRDANKWPEVALRTIRAGRSDKGMPTGKDALSAEKVDKILAFRETVQRDLDRGAGAGTSSYAGRRRAAHPSGRRR